MAKRWVIVVKAPVLLATNSEAGNRCGSCVAPESPSWKPELLNTSLSCNAPLKSLAGAGTAGFHHPGNAPSLRKTQLTRDQIRMTIQCGRPGTPMPYFDRFAYTDKRCYGMTAKDLGDNMPQRAGIPFRPTKSMRLPITSRPTSKVRGW